MATRGENKHHEHPSNDAFDHVVPLYINGKEHTTSTTFPVTSPSTNKEIWKSSSASVEDATAAVEAAQAAFPAWSLTTPLYRRDLLLRTASILTARSSELSSYQALETGAPPSITSGFNLPTSIELLRDCAGRIATSVSGSVPTSSQPGKSAIVVKEPYGVVLGIAPWNAPYILGFRAVVYALAAGNTAILKGSELSPRCWWAIGDVFREAGLPDGVLNLVFHRAGDAAAVTKALIEHPAVRKVNFTGSTATGRIVAELAGRALKPVLLELGGKAPAVVLGDADVELAARAVVEGAFMHAGQICMSTERVVVVEGVVEEFAKEVARVAEEMFPERGGACVLINRSGVEKNRRLVKDAVGKGAKVLVGDIDEKEDRETRMRPIIVQGVDKAMEMFHTESFGPTLSLIAVKGEDEAVALANDTDYGLSASVFTRDLAAGLRIAKRIESGAVHINAMSVHDEAVLPHGGVKMSGFGRFNASYGVEEFLKLKTITWMD